MSKCNLQKIIIVKECEHDWVLEDSNEGWHIRGCGETVERDHICSKCGLKAREVYLFSCMITEHDEII